MKANTTGTSNNTALGPRALHFNTTAVNNVAVGDLALGANTTGNNNVAVGTSASSCSNYWRKQYNDGGVVGELITTGSSNTIIGRYNGNQSSVDIRTSGTNVILSDGAGKIRFYSNNGDSTAIGHSGDNMLLIDNTMHCIFNCYDVNSRQCYGKRLVKPSLDCCLCCIWLNKHF